MDRRSAAVLVCVAAVSAGVAVAWWHRPGGTGPQTVLPALPAALYCKVALPPRGEKTVSVAFRSSRPGGTRDVLEVDLNGDGRMGPDERYVGQPGSFSSTQRYTIFPTIPLTRLSRPKQLGDTCDLELKYLCSGRGVGARETTEVWFWGSMTRGGEQWEYRAYGTLPLRASLAEAQTIGAQGSPAVEVMAKPHAPGPGQTQIGARCLWGQMTLSVTRDEGPLGAKVTVVNPVGRTVYAAHTTDWALGFG